MLAIHYCRQDERTQRFTTERTQIAVGRAPGNDLVLSDLTVSARHCLVTVQEGVWVVDDLNSERGTRINGKRIAQPEVFGEHDRLYIGAFVLQLEEVDGRLGSIEAGLLDGIARGDDDSRTIYADWLEERGELVRAEFLRVQQAIIDAPIDTPTQKAAFVSATERLRDLAASIDVDWRMRVARPVVEGCRVAFEIPCKMDWGQLEPTDQPDVRHCNTCRKTVRYCTSEQDALDLADQGQCVVVDVRQAGIACVRCGREVPRSSQLCFSCGAIQETLTEVETFSGTIGVVIPRDFEPPLARGRLVPREYTGPVLTLKQCPNCHAANPAVYRFCLDCGTRLAEAR
ncbi:MAG TPA: FHA domain-containing protein [Kofleriaceae bacterium]|nr:FHA domain-containing protein [Kofleriaceae bacterium]